MAKDKTFSKEFSKDAFFKLVNEVRMSEEFNTQELEPCIEESTQRYLGTWLPAIGSDWDINLNEVYPIVQFYLPNIFFRNPRVFLKPHNKTFLKKARNPISGVVETIEANSQKSAITQEAILNYDLQEINYKDEVRRVLLDSLIYPFGILWHGYKGNFGMTEEQSLFIKDDKIFVKRISPLRFLHDPSVSVSDIHEGQWVARSFDVPLKDVLEDDQFNIDKSTFKKGIKGFKGYGQSIGTKREDSMERNGGDRMSIGSLRKKLLQSSDPRFQESEQAKFVTLYEVFIRPTKKQKREGGKGHIVVFTDEQDTPLRVSPWSIKAEGFPVQILEFSPVPESQFGLSDVDIYKGISDMKNAIRNLQLRNAQQNTKVYIAMKKEAADEEDVLQVKDGNQTIIRMPDVDNVRNELMITSAGGNASSELYTIDQRLQRELEDKSGVSDLKKGFLQSGEESATSVKIRNAGSAARPAYRQDLMAEFLRKSCLYLLQLEKQFLTIKDAVRIIGSLELEWSENPTKEDIQADVDVEIDVISMLPESPEKELQELNTILQLMFQGLTVPEIRMKLQQENRTINISPLIEQILLRLKIRNPEIFRPIKPEESQGFVSVQQVREAKDNVRAALSGQEIPNPPAEEDDHVAKLEVYGAVQEILEAAGQVSDLLVQLIQTQQLLLQAQQEKNATPGQKANLKGPLTQKIGA